jgi:hypothetical protein
VGWTLLSSRRLSVLLPAYRRTVGVGGVEFADHHRHDGVLAQLVVVVEVLVAQRNVADALRQ